MTKQLDYKSSIEERQDLFDKVYDCLLSVVSSEHISDSNFIPSMFWGRSQSQAELIYYVICKAKSGDLEAEKILRDAVSSHIKGEYIGALSILKVSSVSELRYSFYKLAMFLEGSQSQAEAIYYVICKARHGDLEADKILRKAVSAYVEGAYID